MPRPRFPFSTAPRCRKRSSSAPRRSAIRRSRCSIATASTGSRAFISPRRSAGLKAIVGAELTMSLGARGSGPGIRVGSGAGSGTDDRANRHSSESRASSPDPGSSATRPRRVAQGYQNLCRLMTRMKLRGAERRRARSRSTRSTAGRRAGRARRPRDAERAALRRRRAWSIGWSGVRRGACLRRAAAPPAARRGVRQPRAARSRRGVSRADHRHQRRPLRRAGRSAALRRAHLHPSQDDARARRAASELERRALPEDADAMAQLFGDMPEAHRRHARARGSPRVHDGGSRLPLSGIPGAAGGDDGVVPAQDHAGGRARTLPAVSRPRARARSSASWI